MKIETTKNLTDGQKEIVARLWNAEYPVNIGFAAVSDFENFMNGVTERLHYLLFDEEDVLRGWLMTFTRAGERWFSVIVDGSRQKKGYGRALLDAMKTRETEINGWVVPHDEYFKADGANYVSPLAFYRKNDFLVLSDIVWDKPGFAAVKIKWTKNNPAD